MKAIFKSLCPDRLSFWKQETRSSSPSASNRFEALRSLPSESEVRSASDDRSELDETHYEHSGSKGDEAEDHRIKNDTVIEDLELHFTVWVRSTLSREILFELSCLQNLETTCGKVETYWAQAAVGRMPIMLAGFLTNAAIASVASRFLLRRRFSNITELISDKKSFEWFASSITGTPETSGFPDSVVTNAFIRELQAPFLAILLCQKGDNSYAQQVPHTMIGKPQDQIAALETPPNSIGRVCAELELFDSVLMSMKQLPHLEAKDRYDFVMGFHPFIPPPDLHRYLRPIPTSATFVLRLIVESYKSWSILPTGEQRVPNPSLRIHVLSFAQDVHKNVVRFRLSEPFEPRPGCNCEDYYDPGLMEKLRTFETDLALFISEKKFDLYH